MKLLAEFSWARTHAVFSYGLRVLSRLTYALSNRESVSFPCRLLDVDISTLLWKAFRPEPSTGIALTVKRNDPILRRGINQEVSTGRRKSLILAATGTIPAGTVSLSKSMFSTNFMSVHSRQREPSMRSFLG